MAKPTQFTGYSAPTPKPTPKPTIFTGYSAPTPFTGYSAPTPTQFTGYSVPTPLAPTPLTPTLPVSTSPPPPIKTAPIDTILFDEESIPIEVMSDLIFENIGGQELLSISRSDIVNGQKILYQPIKNLSAIQQQYNPNNILGLQQIDNKYFAGFAIKLENKIPQEGNGANGDNVYLNELGDLIIELINLNNDEQVEVQISINGTIYEANFGDYSS